MKIAVASGKGGTGKTFVAVNLFHSLKNKGKCVALADCDVEVPNALAFFEADLCNEIEVTEFRPIIHNDQCVFCGKCVEYCEYHAIFYMPSSRYIRLLNDLCHGCAACSVACESGAIENSSTVVGTVSSYKYQNSVCLAEGRMTTGHPSPVPLIKATMKNAFQDQSEYELYDSPPGTSCPFIQTVAKSDFVILVKEPTPFGLSDLKQAIDTLLTMGKAFGVVINRAGVGDSEVYDYLERNGYTLLAEIPFEEEIARLYSEGKVVSEHHEGANIVFHSLADKLIAYGNSSN